MKRKMDLCGRCAATLGNTYRVHKASGGVDNKVTCESCHRRRFGGTYEVEIGTDGDAPSWRDHFRDRFERAE